MYDEKVIYEILLKKEKDGNTEVGILVDGSFGPLNAAFRAKLYMGDLLVKSEDYNFKLVGLSQEVQSLIRNGSPVNLVDLDNDVVIPVEFTPSLNGA